MKTPARHRLLQIEITPRSIAYVLVAAAGVWLFWKLWVIGLLLIVTLVFVGTLSPVVEWLEKKGIRRMRALLMIFFALSVVAALVLGLTVPPFVEQLAQIAHDA